MTDTEKKLLQAQHRLEEAQARDRVKERKARTRRLIQEGAILEKVLPEMRTMELPALEGYLSRKLGKEISISDGRSPGHRGPSSFFSRRAHLLTTCKTGGGMPAASCALRGGLRLLRQPPDNATAPASAAVIVCAIGQIPSLQPTLFSNRLRKPATGSFAAEMDRRSARPFSLLQKRNRKKKTR